MPFNKIRLLAPLTLLVAVALSACGPEGVNGSVHVGVGETQDRATTVNGGVNVDDNAKVGTAKTVNGGIRIGDNVTAGSAETVNGGVRIGSNTKVERDVTTVNGGIQLASGADVGGRVSNVNGGIRLTAAHIGGGISTANGDIDVGSHSRVEGGIHVNNVSSVGFGEKRIPRIVIGPMAEVDGTLKFERKVDLYVSESAKIGPVEGATPVSFTGERPEGSGDSDGSDSDGPEKN